jgi:hypothetical protein
VPLWVLYVEPVAGQNDELILSVGLDVARPVRPGPSHAAGADGDHDGEIDLAWDTARGARSYLIERGPDPLLTFNHALRAASSGRPPSTCNNVDRHTTDPERLALSRPFA